MTSMLPSILLYAGLAASLVGLASILVPIRLLGIRTRRAGAIVLVLGIALALAMAAWPVQSARSEQGTGSIADAMPTYDFREVHSIRLRASRGRAYAAIRSVTPGEIRLFQTLMGIRALPEKMLKKGERPSLVPGYAVASSSRREGSHEFRTSADGSRSELVTGTLTTIDYQLATGAAPSQPAAILERYTEGIRGMGGERIATADCCRAAYRVGAAGRSTWIEVTAEDDGKSFRLVYVEPSAALTAQTPIIDLFLNSGFTRLAETRDRELVLGEVLRGRSTDGAPPSRLETLGAFRGFGAPNSAKVAFNLLLADDGPGWTRVTTETRVLATDPATRSMLAVYWRLIYPGSAIIRRSLLEAVKQRAERPAS